MLYNLRARKEKCFKCVCVCLACDLAFHSTATAMSPVALPPFEFVELLPNMPVQFKIIRLFRIPKKLKLVLV